MLLGFLIQDHDDWQDFCARMNNVSMVLLLTVDKAATELPSL
jgi:hypothetical protein